MGSCFEREKEVLIPGLTEEEETILKSEYQLQLQKVKYDTFQGAIKRFGYKNDLNDQHMDSISEEIKLDHYKMENDPNSTFALVYLDPQFRSEDKRHNVTRLMQLGWFVCIHDSEDVQSNELWHLVNPDLQDTVPKKDIEAMMRTLVYFAVNIQQKTIIAKEESIHNVKNAVDYINDTLKKSDDWLSSQLEQLPKRVCKEDLVQVFQKSFYRTYQLRMSINGLQQQLIDARQEAMKQAKSGQVPAPTTSPKKKDTTKKSAERQSTRSSNASSTVRKRSSSKQSSVSRRQ